jgi:hypothetical protein
VDDTQKSELLGGACALVFPTHWEETFGLVMVEAMACGTPVIGFARGAVPEVVRDGVNGYLCRSVEEAVAAVKRLDLIDRGAVRADCEARFSDSDMVSAYEACTRTWWNDDPPRPHGQAHFPDGSAATHQVRLLAPHLAGYGWGPPWYHRSGDYESRLIPISGAGARACE